jgi:hypothetical protein
MLQHVVDNFKSDSTKIHIIKRDEHQFNIPNVKIWNIDYITDGPATTCSLTRDEIDMDSELIITNCDQIIKDWNQASFLDFARDYDGVLGCFISQSPKNSYVMLNDENLVIKIREKEVISNLATNGLHYWKKARYFFDSYDSMKSRSDTVNGEYYVAPSYNYMIEKGMKIGIFMFNQHFPIGTPEDLKKYLYHEGNKI